MRFIPTRVGNTTISPNAPSSNPVHPHARGEHCRPSPTICSRRGSSPRAWGTQRCTNFALVERRFIPTRVGNTRGALTRLLPAPVHPHARGEHMRLLHRQEHTGGSSPRAWGTHMPPTVCPAKLRFIPTRVGNTWLRAALDNCFAVHPHARGEHDLAVKYFFGVVGSSPRAWGTRLLDGGHSGWDAVHPHARGEHICQRDQFSRRAGSSPRAWGTRLKGVGCDCVGRFIPTRVGNTCRCVCTQPTRPVHPHARGEHFLRLAVNNAVTGSSPRAWGTPSKMEGEPDMLRFIPTRVGNTYLTPSTQ